MQIFIDPPNGSIFGFPKSYDADPADFRGGRTPNFNSWLIENGYPRYMVDRYAEAEGGPVPVRLIGNIRALRAASDDE